MKTGSPLSAAGRTVAVALVLLWSLGPIAMIVFAAFTPERDIFAPGRSLLAWRPTFEHFVGLWTRWGDFFTGLRNSLIITVGATVFAVAVSTLAGYGYSRWRSAFPPSPRSNTRHRRRQCMAHCWMAIANRATACLPSSTRSN